MEIQKRKRKEEDVLGFHDIEQLIQFNKNMKYLPLGQIEKPQWANNKYETISIYMHYVKVLVERLYLC